MAKRYSITAGRVVDVPETKGTRMDDDIDKRIKALEGGERIKALEEELTMLRASNRQLMRECDDLKAQLAQSSADLAAARQAPATPAAPPVVNVPAPVVNVQPPVIHMQQEPAPSEFDIQVKGRDGMGRPLGYRVIAVAPLKL